MQFRLRASVTRAAVTPRALYLRCIPSVMALLHARARTHLHRTYRAMRIYYSTYVLDAVHNGFYSDARNALLCARHLRRVHGVRTAQQT